MKEKHRKREKITSELSPIYIDIEIPIVYMLKKKKRKKDKMEVGENWNIFLKS